MERVLIPGIPNGAAAPGSLVNDEAPPAGGISQLAEHLFRQESGKLVSVLTGIFGLEHLQLAEDVVQDALIRALQTWPFYGVPKNPAAWLTQTAKNLALDVLRREKRFAEKQPAVIAMIEQTGGSEEEQSPGFETEIQDSRLRLMFACCHPNLAPEAQTALALKTLCGFSPADIAQAFLTTEAAIAKRLTRARQRIAELRLPFAIPAGPDLPPRLGTVLHTLYLLFNEGYKASSGEHLVKEDLCQEAIRLMTLLSQHPAGDQPRTRALLALMLFNAARLPARSDAEGQMVPLKSQDRSRWDREMIARGLEELQRSAAGNEASVYHYEAAIAACHAIAPDDAGTNWPRILELYGRLLGLEDSPVIALNRAVAVRRVHGADAALAAVRAIKDVASLDDYYLYHAVLADIQMERGEFAVAVIHLTKALQRTPIESERAVLRKRLADCQAGRA